MGAVDLQGRRDFPAARLGAMLAAVAHRGPDEASHREPGLALGTRHWAVPGATGHLPRGEDGTVAVADGVIFAASGSAGPERAGRRPTGQTAGDFWAQRYADRGTPGWGEVRGQFAVALWDRRQRRLELGRDRAGLCPLHHTTADGWLLFASEIKALLASGLVAAELDPAGLDHFFSFCVAPARRTLFAGVTPLPPGWGLSVAAGSVTTAPYWQLEFPDSGAERGGEPGRLARDLGERLEQAVTRRLSDGLPTASYLSGGLDSSVVLALTGRVAGRAVPAFSVSLDHAGHDERGHAASVARALGAPLTVLARRGTDLAQAYPELTEAAETPVHDTSCAGLMALVGEVRQAGHRVVLSGEGADEALAGYVWFKGHTARRALARRWPRLAQGSRDRTIALVDPAAPPSPFELAGVRAAQQDVWDLAMATRHRLYSSHLRQRLAGHSVLDDLGLPWATMGRWHPLNQSLFMGYQVMLPGLLTAAKGDRIAQHHAVEPRCPFLDEDVVDFCADLDPGLKLHGLTGKYLLRRTARDLLPPAAVHRPKAMFRASLSRLFLGPERPRWVDQLLSVESMARTGLFDAAQVARQVAWQRTVPPVTLGRLAFDWGLTNVVATQLWHHLFLGGGLCELPPWTPPRGRPPVTSPEAAPGGETECDKPGRPG